MCTDNLGAWSLIEFSGESINHLFDSRLHAEKQLQRTRTAHVGGHYGHAHILRAGLRRREERGEHEFHLYATSEENCLYTQ